MKRKAAEISVITIEINENVISTADLKSGTKYLFLADSVAIKTTPDFNCIPDDITLEGKEITIEGKVGNNCIISGTTVSIHTLGYSKVIADNLVITGCILPKTKFTNNSGILRHFMIADISEAKKVKAPDIPKYIKNSSSVALDFILKKCSQPSTTISVPTARTKHIQFASSLS